MNLKFKSSQLGEQTNRYCYHLPCKADHAIIDVYKAQIRGWNPDIQDINDELEAGVRTHPTAWSARVHER